MEATNGLLYRSGVDYRLRTNRAPLLVCDLPPFLAAVCMSQCDFSYTAADHGGSTWLALASHSNSFLSTCDPMIVEVQSLIVLLRDGTT